MIAQLLRDMYMHNVKTFTCSKTLKPTSCHSPQHIGACSDCRGVVRDEKIFMTSGPVKREETSSVLPTQLLRRR